MILLDDVDDMLNEKPVAKGTADNYRRSVRFWGEFMEHPAIRTDLEAKKVNAWLADLQRQRTNETARCHRQSIIRIWNWLADQDLVNRYDSRRLRRITLAPKIPHAWSMDEVRLLLSAAKLMPGTLRCGVTASKLMHAWVLVGYESALRPGDIRKLKPEDIGSDGVIRIVQSKTSHPHSCTLSSFAMKAIEPLMASGQATLFPCSRNTVRRWELRLFAQAKSMGFRKRIGQGLGTLRKTNATEVCRVEGLEAAAKSLGHVSGTRLARLHYVAPDAIATPSPPPALFDGNRTPKSNQAGRRDRPR